VSPVPDLPDPPPGPVAVGVDTGGTFTDLVAVRGDALEVRKVPSTPDDPARAVRDGLGELPGGDGAGSVVHGTTVGTNALLERRGARTALVTTEGFEDVLEIARQDRPRLYDLSGGRPEPLVGREARFGVRERALCDGSVLRPLDPEEADRAVERVRASGCEAAAVAFLHSYANPEHERSVVERLRGAGIAACASHEVLREFREYERFVATAVNAYLLPGMAGYLERLQAGLPGARLRVMESGGGAASAARAAGEPVRTLLSGPAGGVVGAFEVARRAGFDRVLTLDMGGTSTDVSLCPGRVRTTAEAEVAGFPLRLPILDVHTVGAGGGSLARVDAGGALRVGPESAGADPGPACYGRGGERVAVTDANLALGYLPADRPLAGTVHLREGPMRAALDRLAGDLGVAPLGAAEGVRTVVNASMERALRVISVERGFDPREFALVAFGGAGPLHACDLAGALGVRSVIVPAMAGVLSALGMLLAELLKDVTATVLLPLAEAEGAPLDARFRELEEEAVSALEAEGFARSECRLEESVSLRYAGQSFELEVARGEGLAERFHAAHQDRYGYRDDAREVQVVNLRVRAAATPPRPPLPEAPLGDADAAAALAGGAPVRWAGEGAEGAPAAVYERERLRPGMRFRGPALVCEYSATTAVPPGWEGRVDGLGNLVLEGG
jgi:N-methylhydantoinase A